MKKVFKNEFTQITWERMTKESGIDYDLFNAKEVKEIEQGIDKYIQLNGCYWTYSSEIMDYLYEEAYHKEVIQPMIASNKMMLDAIAQDNMVDMGHF